MQYSPDGLWVWNGTQWVPAPPARHYRRKQTNHIFHLLMTLFTVGLWSPIWFFVAMANGFTREPTN